MRDTFPVVVHTVVMRGRSLLLLRRARTGFFDGFYALPGGHLLRGEGVVDCAIRELREETGISAERAHLRPAAALPYLSDDQQGVDFIMMCQSFSGEPHLAEPDRFDAIGWWDVDALPESTVPYLAPALALVARGEWFFEFNRLEFSEFEKG